MTLQGSESNSLTLARSLLGQVHRSGTCTSIQATVIKVDHRNALMFSTFGLGAIASAFEEAAMFYTHTNGYFSSKQKHVAGEALAFIQGTGL